jgi:hypothetical protein
MFRSNKSENYNWKDQTRHDCVHKQAQFSPFLGREGGKLSFDKRFIYVAWKYNICHVLMNKKIK